MTDEQPGNLAVVLKHLKFERFTGEWLYNDVDGLELRLYSDTVSPASGSNSAFSTISQLELEQIELEIDSEEWS